MMTYRLFSTRLIITATILILMAVRQTAFGAETESALSSTGELGLDAERYYTLGYKAAKDTYSGFRPVVTGICTGFTVPIVTVSAVAATNEIHDLVGILSGAIAFSFLVRSGYKLSINNNDKTLRPKLTNIPQPVQDAYENGYSQGIDDRRRLSYIFGILTGIGLNLYIISLLLGDMGGYS